MTNNIDRFYRGLKEKVSVSPSLEVDQHILKIASEKLSVRAESFSWSTWLKPSLAFACAAVLITMINIKSHHQNEVDKLAMNESAEMVLNYKNIELMADAGSLSEEDWKKIGVTGVTR
jgi:hypothetical protein